MTTIETARVWARLLPIAMVGTDRPAALPAWPGEIGELVAQVAADAADSPARQLLRAAAVLATCERAGALPPEAAPLPPVAPPDVRPAPPDGPLREGLRWLLQDGPARLQQHALATLAARGHRLPEALLPAALDLGRRSLALRPALLPVVGERGRWLAGLREDWRYAAGPGEETSSADERWSQGSLDQRRELLAAERAADPAAARERLRATLGELPARERADLAAVLAVNLGPDDEDLLETLRADRSREVRAVAVALLPALPQAAHPRRAAGRVEALLRQERTLLRKRWRIEPPAAVADDWAADGVEAARPSHDSLGERGWWLYQLVRQVPLGWWTRHLDLDPDGLLRWAVDTEWAEALLRGWVDVLATTREPVWCEALLARWPDKYLHSRIETGTVLGWLPSALRERHWLGHLAARERPLAHVLAPMIAGCAPGSTLSAELSAAVAAETVRHLRADALRTDLPLRALLPELGGVLHADALSPPSPLAAELPRAGDETPAMQAALHAFAQGLALRRALDALPAADVPSPTDPRTP